MGLNSRQVDSQQVDLLGMPRESKQSFTLNLQQGGDDGSKSLGV